MTNVTNTENVANNVANEKVQHSRKISIDDFMRDVAPYMHKGWIAMDENGLWSYYIKRPKKYISSGIWAGSYEHRLCVTIFKNIKRVKDWTQSLRRVE